MLAVVYTDLIPESIELIGGAAQAWMLGSVVAMVLLDWGVRRHAHGADARTVIPATLLAADALHNVTDGAAIAAGFLISPRAGFITTLAVIVHEVPEEVGDFAILRRTGMAKGTALIWLGVVQLTATIGAVATFVAATVYGHAAGAALAVAGGTFLYISLTNLLPDVLERQPDRRSRTIGLIAFLFGVAAVIAPSILWSER
jgi:zinc and cadmium transporter